MLCNIVSLQEYPLKACKFTAYRCILWKLVSLQLIGLYFTARVFLGSNLLPTRSVLLPSTWPVTSISKSDHDRAHDRAQASKPASQDRCPPDHQKVTKTSPKTILRDTKSVKKWKNWNVSKTRCFYCVYSTYRHCILASFPSLDHQKHGPGHCLPFGHTKSQTNH